MKRIVKIFAWVLGLVVLAAGVFAAFVTIKGVPDYPKGVPAGLAALKAPADSAHVARGAKIATLLCNECHKGSDGKLTGKHMKDLPKEFGTVYSYNITQHPEHGIGTWTDGELYYFLRTGIRKDGSWAPPMMPKFPLMADDDLLAVIAWLRSDDPALAPDTREYPPNQYNFLVKLLSNTAFAAPPMPEKPVLVPDSSNSIAFGKYVADGLCACYQCHSKDFKTMDILVPERSEGYYGGGNPMLNMEGDIIPSANITMNKENGIGSWTQQQFLEAVKFGKNPRGGPLRYPMFPHTTLTDTEVNAVWAFLQTIPPVQGN